MDPYTFGMVSVGVAGGSLVVVSYLESRGVVINKTLIGIALEASKLGAIWYLMKEMAKVFL
ncbi:hypothetical protein J14TS2_45260 [Bacillus sp. J14TS2]|uniref:hypothetical protein n=1 Tax=Bacillus sp. J14TS2 TaxID=2807188 RepID=UPI001B102084|nr:hypothetical protein [Bacillus sp. J14TS2]GIN74051.1 hypothetical protein J14TS2_45260 [Bacillus sp. J14TS2]